MIFFNQIVSERLETPNFSITLNVNLEVNNKNFNDLLILVKPLRIYNVSHPLDFY